MPYQRTTLPVPCAQCGEVFQVRTEYIARGRGKFCSRACQYAPKASTFTVGDDGVTAVIALHDRHGRVKGHTVIDLADAERACQRRWSLSSDGYAVRSEYPNGRHVSVLLHRELLGLVPGDGMEGDHKDRDRLNNRRSNLRALTKAGNTQNTSSASGSLSSYRGVSWFKSRGKWVAYIKSNGKSRTLGYFDSELEAAEAARTARAVVMAHATD